MSDSQKNLNGRLLISFFEKSHENVAIDIEKAGSVDSDDVLELIPALLDLLLAVYPHEEKSDVEFAKIIDKQARIILKDWLHKKLSAQTEA